MHSRQVGWKPVLVLLGIGLLAHIAGLNGGFIMDDDVLITHSSVVQEPGGLYKIWIDPGMSQFYFPLVHSSLWLDWHLFGTNTVGYHAQNILLHLVNALLVWFLLRRLRVKGAWFAAALFAVHPVHVESVAWISERKNVLSGLFYLLAMLSYLRFFILDRAERKSASAWASYILAFVAFIAALLSKIVTCTFPVVLLLLIWWRERRLPLRHVFYLIPFFLSALVLGYICATVEINLWGAEGPTWVFTITERVLIAGRALWFYVGKLLMPIPLIYTYPLWFIDTTALWQYMYPAMWLMVMGMVWLFRNKLGRGPITAISVFVVTLLPAIGFSNFAMMRFTYVADHFQYLASIALLALWVSMFHTPVWRDRFALLGRISFGVVITTLIFLSANHSLIFRNKIALFRDIVRKNPDSWIALNNLGVEYKKNFMLEEAAQFYSRSLQKKWDVAMRHNTLAQKFTALGRPQDARRHYQKTLQIDPENKQALKALHQ